jgi:hypothetical protein
MTRIPRPLANPPRDTARPPTPRPTEDHQPHLSGGARYASAYRMQARPRPPRPPQNDRGRSWPAAAQVEAASR